MELIWQISSCIGEYWKAVLNFCDNYANVAAIISLFIGLLGFLGVEKLIRKHKETKKFHNMFIKPVQKRSAAEQLDAYIDATYNGASNMEVDNNE